MTLTRWLAAPSLALALSTASAAQQQLVPDQVEVEDADTLLVRVADTRYRIQLPGIDAPENTVNPKLQRDISRTGLAADVLLPLGEAAAVGISELLDAFRPYRLVFDPDARDRYGRTPGDLLDAGGRSLSLGLVEAGFAVPVKPAPDRAAELDAALRQAREAGRGLWGDRRQLAESWAGL